MKTKEQSKAWIVVKFILILVVAGVAGGCASFLVGYLTDGAGIALGGIKEPLAVAVPVAFVVCNILAAVVALAQCRRAKKQIRAWDGEDESIEQVERRLNYPLLLANGMMVLNFLLFPISVEISENTAFGERYGVILFPVCLAAFILGHVWIIAVTGKAVRLEQQINPEKRGNVLDTKFHKQWMNSCDEAEKFKIYQASYSGYRAGNTACLVMWLAAVFAQLWAGTGVFPVVCVCVIWMALMMGYMFSSMKLEKR